MTTLSLSSSPERRFHFDTASMGRLGANRITGGDAIKIGEHLAAHKDASASALIDKLLALLVITADGNGLTPEQITGLSAAEKEDFSENLLRTHDYMNRKQSIERNTDGKGETVVSFKKGDVILERNPDEKPSEFFKRIYTAYNERQNRLMARALGMNTDLDKAIKNLTGWAKPSALDALSANAAISDSLSAKIAAIRFPEIPALTSLPDSLRGFSGFKAPSFGLGIPGTNGAGSADDDSTSTDFPKSPLFDVTNLPRSPVYDTNERLDSLIERFDRFEGIAVEAAQLVKTMTDAASVLLQSFGEGAKSTEQYARRSISIAIIALMTTILIAAFQLGYGIWQSSQQDGATKAIVESIVRQVTSSQQESSNGIRETITNQADRVHADQVGLAKAISAVGDALRSLKGQSPQSTDAPPDHGGD